MAATLTRVEEATAREPSGALSDTELAAAIAAGEREALTEAYDRYGPTCYRVALRVTANPALAEEVVQEVFVALWRRDHYRAERGSLRTFVLATAHHKAVDAVRRESSLARRESAYAGRDVRRVDAHAEPETVLLDGLRDGEVREALLELSGPQRQALLLSYFGGHTQQEISEMIGVPLGTVKTRMFAGMRRMHARLSETSDERGRDER